MGMAGPVVIYLVLYPVLLAIGGFIVGWSFRKGWDRAGR